MKTRGFLLIDGSNIGYKEAAGTELKVGEQHTTAIYGMLRTLRPMIATFSMLKPIVLWDGASWRKKHFAEYKATRDTEAPKNKSQELQQELRKQFKTQIPFIKRALTHLAVPQMWALNLEADDLAAMLVRRYARDGKKIMLISADKDWVQLVQPGVGWHDPIGTHKVRKITHETIESQLGVKSARAWLELKALVGDTSDEIPGVGGIGDKGAAELLNTYGSVADFLNRTIDSSMPKLPKKFEDFAKSDEKQDIFKRNLRLMDLNSSAVPAPIDLKVNQGKYDEEAFAKFCNALAFRSITKDLSEWCEPFRMRVQ